MTNFCFSCPGDWIALGFPHYQKVMRRGDVIRHDVVACRDRENLVALVSDVDRRIVGLFRPRVRPHATTREGLSRLPYVPAAIVRLHLNHFWAFIDSRNVGKQ
ncbi:hypothetical protein J6590_011283 [Homalodisca vitripennis]|nr:hypothetical protein J6590_011283 [Homalodisca vitripennis]